MEPAPIDPTAGRRLLDLLGSDRSAAGDRGFLEEVLHLWAGAHGIRSVALYAEADGMLSREASTGSGGDELPRTLGAPGTGAQERGVERLDLPGGSLVWTVGPAAAEVARDDLPALLVAAALRICSLRRQARREAFQMRYRGVELEALYDVGLAIASTLDIDTLGDEILLRAVSLLDARRGALYLAREGATDGAVECRLEASFGGEAAASIEPGALAAEAADGVAVLPGAQHLLSVPIAVDGAERGVLVVGDKESRQGVGPFSSEDRRTLGLFANQAAIALENARLHREALEKERYARDMQLAAEIQRRILPRGVPASPGFELTGWNRPAREVGGDYYDFVELAGGRVGVVLGDVSGKGVPAALMVSTLHSAVRLLLDRMELGPELLERLNRHILDSSAPNKFITLMIAALDPEARRLTYLNAGHNPGLVLRADGTVETMPSGGVPVGMLPGSRYRSGVLELTPGDLVCLYSDGITEAESPGGEEMGEKRLAEVLRTTAELPLREIVQRIDQAVVGFTGGGPQGDDQTVVLVRCRG